MARLQCNNIWTRLRGNSSWSKQACSACVILRYTITRGTRVTNTKPATQWARTHYYRVRCTWEASLSSFSYCTNENQERKTQYSRAKLFENWIMCFNVENEKVDSICEILPLFFVDGRPRWIHSDNKNDIIIHSKGPRWKCCWIIDLRSKNSRWCVTGGREEKLSSAFDVQLLRRN